MRDIVNLRQSRLELSSGQPIVTARTERLANSRVGDQNFVSHFERQSRDRHLSRVLGSCQTRGTKLVSGRWGRSFTGCLLTDTVAVLVNPYPTERTVVRLPAAHDPIVFRV